MSRPAASAPVRAKARATAYGPLTVFFMPDPDNYEPFVLRPIVFAVFEIILVNLLINGPEL